VLETCAFFGKSLEAILKAGDFTIPASSIRRGVRDCPDDSKFFQKQSLRAEKTEKKQKQISGDVMRKALHISLYGQEDASKFGMRRVIKQAYSRSRKRNQNQNESTEIE
jgi:hypothetical protein